jgi:hypothetical protein
MCSIQRLVELQAPGTGRREAGGIRRALFGGRCVACGKWWAAYCGRNHDVGRYHSLKLIFTATRSHNAVGPEGPDVFVSGIWKVVELFVCL